MKELEEEIGELNGMDDDMIDCVGFGSSTHSQRVGSFVSMSSLPAEWREDMEFFKDLDTINTTKMTGLRAGKAAEQAEFDNLLREVEKELDQASSQAPRRRSEDEVLAVQEDGPADPSMAAASGEAESAPGNQQCPCVW